jgi:ATP phosphoribosyltransferase
MRVAVALGRLEQPAWQWLKERGIVSGPRPGRVLTLTPRANLEVAVMRGRDIPQLVASGVVDAGLVGRDVVLESGLPLTQGSDLGFGRCRLVLAAPSDDLPTTRPLRVATKYPRILREWARLRPIDVEPVVLTGSVEVAPRLNLADAILDVVETGETLRANGLKPVETVLESWACWVSRPGEVDFVRWLESQPSAAPVPSVRPAEERGAAAFQARVDWAGA